MSERTRDLLTVVVIAGLAIALGLMISTRPVHDDRVESIGSRIKCPVCQGESIANSPSQMAEDMMDLVAERVASGASDDEIVAELLGSYSGALLLDPPASGSTLLLWLAPIVALMVGVAVIMWWRRHPGPDAGEEPSTTTPRSRSRLVVGGIVLVAVFAGIVVVAGNSLQDGVSAAEGVADLEGQDLSDVSNETMEAVIAANLDNPQIAGMRLALAERYFESGDYRSAFPHYLAVAENANATSGQAVTALVRLGWMAFEGNGEVETATRLIDEALVIDPDSPVALYLRARVRWCGAGEAEEAAEVFAMLLDDPDLDDGTRSGIEADLDAARAGEACP